MKKRSFPEPVNLAKISVTVSARSGFTLNKLKPRGKGPAKDWLLIKKRDEHARDDWQVELALTDEKRRSLEERIPPCETS